jgi:hypothetical protein
MSATDGGEIATLTPLEIVIAADANIALPSGCAIAVA